MSPYNKFIVRETIILKCSSQGIQSNQRILFQPIGVIVKINVQIHRWTCEVLSLLLNANSSICAEAASLRSGPKFLNNLFRSQLFGMHGTGVCAKAQY